MTLAFNFDDIDTKLIQRSAAKQNLSLVEFARQAMLKAAHNAEYLSMLDESRRQIAEGKIVSFSDEEWDKFVQEQELR